MTPRLPRLLELLEAAGLTGAVISRPEHVFYLSGYSASRHDQTFLTVGPGGTALVARGGQALQPPVTTDIAVFPYEFYRPTELRDAAAAAEQALLLATDAVGLRGCRVGVEDTHLSARMFRALAQTCEPVPLGGEIERLRRQKDDDEIALIRRAVAINDRGFEAARRAIRPGATELDVWAAVYREILLAHGAAYTLEADCVSGPRTERIGGPPTDRKLEPGDLFILDLFPFLGWYKGDVTRSFVVGRASPRQRAMHAVLEDALAQGAAAIKPGLRACDLDAVVRGAIRAAGSGDYFPHHSGHGIGLGHPEPPYIIPADPTLLQPRMVITLEPGIYVPGSGGMRLEQNYLVTEDGAEPLSTFPLALVECE